MNSTKLPWIVGFIAAVMAIWIFSAIEGPRRCNDGSSSSSIGRKGACSHHGGVGGTWSPILGLAVGVAAGFWTANAQISGAERRRRKLDAFAADAQITPIPEPYRTEALETKPIAAWSPSRTCGECGAGMRAVQVSAGPPPHGAFWECLNQSCKKLARR